MSSSARSHLVLHAVPVAHARQIAWTINRVLGVDPRLVWRRQDVIADYVTAAFSWNELPSVTANLASALAGWGGVWFEVMHEPTAGVDGSLWLHTPTLGLKHRSVDAAGNILVSEFELGNLTTSHDSEPSNIKVELSQLLARPWTDELERFRNPDARSRLLGLTG